MSDKTISTKVDDKPQSPPGTPSSIPADIMEIDVSPGEMTDESTGTVIGTNSPNTQRNKQMNKQKTTEKAKPTKTELGIKRITRSSSSVKQTPDHKQLENSTNPTITTEGEKQANPLEELKDEEWGIGDIQWGDAEPDAELCNPNTPEKNRVEENGKQAGTEKEKHQLANHDTPYSLITREKQGEKAEEEKQQQHQLIEKQDDSSEQRQLTSDIEVDTNNDQNRERGNKQENPKEQRPTREASKGIDYQKLHKGGKQDNAEDVTPKQKQKNTPTAPPPSTTQKKGKKNEETLKKLLDIEYKRSSELADRVRQLEKQKDSNDKLVSQITIEKNTLKERVLKTKTESEAKVKRWIEEWEKMKRARIEAENELQKTKDELERIKTEMRKGEENKTTETEEVERKNTNKSKKNWRKPRNKQKRTAIDYSKQER